MQDLGTASGPSNSLSSAGIALGDWHAVGGGEAGYTVARPDRPEHRLRRRVRRAHHAATTTARGRRGNVSIYPFNPSGHGAEDMQVPLPVDRADPGLAARPEDDLPRGQRALPHHRRGPDVGGDQPRPDAQRQDEAEVVRRPDHRRQHRRRVLLHHLRPRRVAEGRRACSGPAATTAWSTSRSDGGKTWTNVTDEHARAARVGHGQHASRRRRFDAGHRLPGRRRPPPGRHAAVPVEDDRLRQDLEEPGRAGCRPDVYLHVVREDPKKRGHALPRHRARRDASRATTARPGSS